MGIMEIVLPVAVCFIVTAIAGKLLIPALVKLKAGQSIKEIGPSWHMTKQGTPTMGGLLGVGLGRGRQKFLYLPEQYNDFIFSVICEELGLIGACVIMLIFSMLILRGFWIALHARDRFGALLVVGVMTHLALQTFLNIAVVSGFVPTTGISLPFFSYGGTALCLQLVEMGIVLSVSRQIPAARAG